MKAKKGKKDARLIAFKQLRENIDGLPPQKKDSDAIYWQDLTFNYVNCVLICKGVHYYMKHTLADEYYFRFRRL